MLKVLVTIVVIIVSGIIIGTSASHFVKNDNDKQVLSTQSQQTEEELAKKPEAPLPGLPKKVRIPSINVDAEIESVANDSQGRMDTPSNDENTAWYNPGFRPGMNGNAVLAGHYDKKDGTAAVFWDLAKLKVGDEIIVTDDKGKDWTFEVTDSEKYPNKEFPIEKVFGNASAPMLNLITCDGDWNKENGYSDRHVIYSKLVEK